MLFTGHILQYKMMHLKISIVIFTQIRLTKTQNIQILYIFKRVKIVGFEESISYFVKWNLCKKIPFWAWTIEISDMVSISLDRRLTSYCIAFLVHTKTCSYSPSIITIKRHQHYVRTHFNKVIMSHFILQIAPIPYNYEPCLKSCCIVVHAMWQW